MGNTARGSIEDSLMLNSTDMHIKETDLRKAAAQSVTNQGGASRYRNTQHALQFAPHILEQTTGHNTTTFSNSSYIMKSSRRNLNMTQFKRDTLNLMGGNSTQAV